MKTRLNYIVTLIVATWYVAVFLLIPNIPLQDYWSHFALPVLSQDTLYGTLKAFFTKSNEHTIFTAQFIYYINYYLFDGTNKGLFIFNFLMIIVQIIVVGRIIDTDLLEAKKLELIVLLLLISPVAIFHWVSSMSGTTWLLADTFFWMSLYLLIKYLKEEKKILFIPIVIFSILGSLSYSTGIPILFAIYLAYLLSSAKNIKKNLLSILIFALLLIVFYFAFYSMFHAGKGYGASFDLAGFLLFFFSLIGSIFSAKPFTAIPSITMNKSIVAQ